MKRAGISLASCSITRVRRIADIATILGYADPAGFTRAFHPGGTEKPLLSGAPAVGVSRFGVLSHQRPQRISERPYRYSRRYYPQTVRHLVFRGERVVALSHVPASVGVSPSNV